MIKPFLENPCKARPVAHEMLADFLKQFPGDSDSFFVRILQQSNDREKAFPCHRRCPVQCRVGLGEFDGHHLRQFQRWLQGGSGCHESHRHYQRFNSPKQQTGAVQLSNSTGRRSSSRTVRRPLMFTVTLQLPAIPVPRWPMCWGCQVSFKRTA